MVTRKQLIPLNEYQSLASQQKWWSAVWMSMKNILKQWSPLKNNSSTLSSSRSGETQQYVVWALIEEDAQHLLQTLQRWTRSKNENFHQKNKKKKKEQEEEEEETNLDEFVTYSTSLPSSPQLVLTVEELLTQLPEWDQARFNLVLPYLLFKQHVLVFQVHNTVAVKVALHGPVSTVTTQDRALLSLRLTRRQLCTQLQRLETEMERLRHEALSLCRTHRKSEALLRLKRRHLLNSLYQKQSTALQNVIQIMLQLQNTQTDQHLIRVYQLGIEGLRAAQGTQSIDKTLENLDQVMNDFRELAQNQTEVETALTEST